MTTPTGTQRNSFLTGATGFIGSNLAVELLARGRERIHCLVRPTADVTERLHEAVRAAAEAADRLDEVEPELHRLVPLAGDLFDDRLGLADEDLAVLRDDPPAECWHAAASLRYEDRHRDDILRTNVDGTRHVLDAVADIGIGRFHHISTAYVAGVRTGDVDEAPFDPTHAPNNWYEHSKRLGEDLVVERSGHLDQTTVMRPSIVVGNLSTCRSTSTSGYYGFLTGLEAFCRLVERDDPGYLDRNRVRLCLEPESSLNLVPIDALVGEAVELADQPSPVGGDPRYLHLTNPFPIRIGDARVGPESSIDRLRLELVEDPSVLSVNDRFLDDALDFYRPYLRNDKRFLRARDGDLPPEGLLIDDDALVAMSRSHFGRTVDLRSEPAAAR